MYLFDLRTIPSQPWVNGAGTRQALASSQQGTQAAWSLSVARIERDCPFSTYPGFARLHVTMSGAGTHLVGNDVDLYARPMIPVAFDGDVALECHLIDGPCTAFNVIYDPLQLRPDLVVLEAGTHEIAGREIAVFCVSGSASLNGSALQSGQGGVVRSAATITVDAGTVVLRARIDPL